MSCSVCAFVKAVLQPAVLEVSGVDAGLLVWTCWIAVDCWCGRVAVDICGVAGVVDGFDTDCCYGHASLSCACHGNCPPDLSREQIRLAASHGEKQSKFCL